MTTNITKILTIGIIITGVILMAGCIDSDNIGERPSTVRTPISTPTYTPTPTPAPTPAPTPDVGTYLNPVPLNTFLTSDTGIFVVSIGEIDRGERFNRYIKNENMFNDDPIPGYEYMGVLIGFAYSGQDQYMLSGYDFKVYANNVECNSPFVVTPDEFVELEMTTNIMPGGAIVGWKIYEVPTGAQVTLSYERLFSKAYYLDCGSTNFVVDTDALLANG